MAERSAFLDWMGYRVDQRRAIEDKRATPHFVNCSDCASGPSPPSWNSGLGLALDVSCGAAPWEANAHTSALVPEGDWPSKAGRVVRNHLVTPTWGGDMGEVGADRPPMDE